MGWGCGRRPFKWEHSNPLAQAGGQAVHPAAVRELTLGRELLWSSGRDVGRAPQCFNLRQYLTSPARHRGEIICAAPLPLEGTQRRGAGSSRGRMSADLGSG